MINQEGIHQFQVMSLSSMIELRPWAGQLNERRKECLKSFID